MDIEILHKLNIERENRRAVMVVTDLATGKGRLICEGDTVDGDLGAVVGKGFRSGKSGTVEIDGAELFLNVHVPAPRLVVIGAVHISQALTQMAALAGYDVKVIDPRTAFATSERFAGVDLQADWPEDVLKDAPLDAYTALAALTHDPKIDDFPLQEALRVGCFYVGALGSRKTHAKRTDRFTQAGITEVQMEKIHAPIGLNIAAATPAEIAVAVMAEIIETFRKRGMAGL
ncbi:MAG: XdhC/CoxF family protein [Hyphomicrobiales bacterium]|nr:MAG: XdhC/CoxF family protein [Hyphomicrobiales bacterium]